MKTTSKEVTEVPGVSFNVTIPPEQQQEAGTGSERIVPSWLTSEVGLSS